MKAALVLDHDPGQHRSLVGLALVFCLLLWAALLGLPLAGPKVTGLACILLLLFGLPHGTLDLELIKKERQGSPWGLLVLLSVYLGMAAAMYSLWVVTPALALAAFIAIATVHFAEDWEGTGSTFMALGQAGAVLAAPTFLHRSELDSIFIGLTGTYSAHLVTEALTLIGPTAMIVGLGALCALWAEKRRSQAIAGLIVLVAMVLLPPIVGFALYFCLFHSPRHLGDSLSTVRLPRRRVFLRVVLPLTLAAGALAAAIYGLQVRAAPTDRLIAASFMTLSILTVPHMIAPVVMRWLSRPAWSGYRKTGRANVAFTPH